MTRFQNDGFAPMNTPRHAPHSDPFMEQISLQTPIGPRPMLRFFVRYVISSTLIFLLFSKVNAQSIDAPNDPLCVRWRLISEKELPFLSRKISDPGLEHLENPRTFLASTAVFSAPDIDSVLPQTLPFDTPLEITRIGRDFKEQIFEIVRKDSSRYQYPTGKGLWWFEINWQGRLLWIKKLDIAYQSAMGNNRTRYFIVPTVTGGTFNQEFRWRLEKFDLKTQSRVDSVWLWFGAYKMDILPGERLKNVENIVSLHYCSGQCGGGGQEVVILDKGSSLLRLQNGGYDGEGLSPNNFQKWYIPRPSTRQSDSLWSLPNTFGWGEYDVQSLSYPARNHAHRQSTLAFESIHGELFRDIFNFPIATATGKWVWIKLTTTTYYRWDGKEISFVTETKRREFSLVEPDWDWAF